jgi:hypothetical protein
LRKLPMTRQNANTTVTNSIGDSANSSSIVYLHRAFPKRK